MRELPCSPSVSSCGLPVCLMARLQLSRIASMIRRIDARLRPFNGGGCNATLARAAVSSTMS